MTGPTSTGTFGAMGTVVSVRTFASGPSGPDAAAAVEEVFARWEARFSLYDPASELSRVDRGELRLAEASEGLRDAYSVALRWRDATAGAFTPHRPDGAIDLNGVVKALAVHEAGLVLDRIAPVGWAIGAGGDVLVSGAVPAVPLPVGIVDPADRSALVGRIDLGPRGRLAVATSGSAERGDHIWTRAGDGPSPFVQVSVAAGDLVTADVLATAIVAGGWEALDDLAGGNDIDVLAVTRDGGLVATPGWPRAAVGFSDAAGARTATPAWGAAR